MHLALLPQSWGPIPEHVAILNCHVINKEATNHNHGLGAASQPGISLRIGNAGI